MLTYIALALTSLPTATGHAFMYWPPIRGADSDEPYSMGAVPQGPVGTGMPTCGRINSIDKDYLDESGPITQLTAGQKITFQVEVTAHHKGHFQFRLCDRKMSSTNFGADRADQDGCFRNFPLVRARPEEVHSDCTVDDKRGDCQLYMDEYKEYWFLTPPGGNEAVAGSNWNDGYAQNPDTINDHPGLLQVKANSSSAYSAGGLYHMTFKIPSDFSCTACTLQFWYRTANSCTPDAEAYACYFQAMERRRAGSVAEFLDPVGYYPLWKDDKWSGNPCKDVKTPSAYDRLNNCGEQFKNCADVKVVAGGPTPPPTPAPPTTPPTPAPPTPEPEPASEPTTTPEPEPASEPATSGGVCVDGDVSGTYPNHPCSSWTFPKSGSGGHCGTKVLKENCCACGGGGAALPETMAHVGNVKRHRFLASSGSSMLQESEEREQQDEVLSEYVHLQDEL